jgi:hypothetical protein
MTDIKQMLASNLNDLGEIHLSAKDSAVLLTILYDLHCVERMYERLERREQQLIEAWKRFDYLEHWLAGIADGHKYQIGYDKALEVYWHKRLE